MTITQVKGGEVMNSDGSRGKGTSFRPAARIHVGSVHVEHLAPLSC